MSNVVVCLANSLPERSLDRREPDPLLVLRLQHYLSQHCGDRLTLRTLSQALSISESTIKRIIRRTWHCSFHNLLERFRVARMLNYLVKFPNSKAHTLAFEGGWRSRTTLHAAVARVTGLPLGDLRNARGTLPAWIVDLDFQLSVDARPRAPLCNTP